MRWDDVQWYSLMCVHILLELFECNCLFMCCQKSQFLPDWSTKKNNKKPNPKHIQQIGEMRPIRRLFTQSHFVTWLHLSLHSARPSNRLPGLSSRRGADKAGGRWRIKTDKKRQFKAKLDDLTLLGERSLQKSLSHNQRSFWAESCNHSSGNLGVPSSESPTW